MKPSKYLLFPTKNGNWLRDSQGKPRVYKSVSNAVRNLKCFDYDSVQIFALNDVVSKIEFEQFAELKFEKEDK